MARMAQWRNTHLHLGYVFVADVVLALEMQRGVGGEKLRRAARVPFETQARRFEKVRFTDIADHLLVVAGILAEKRVAETARRFEDRGIGGESRGGEQRGFGAVESRIDGVKGVLHCALLAWTATCNVTGNHS